MTKISSFSMNAVKCTRINVRLLDSDTLADRIEDFHARKKGCEAEGDRASGVYQFLCAKIRVYEAELDRRTQAIMARQAQEGQISRYRFRLSQPAMSI